MAIWRKPLQFINVMLANRSPMSVAERGPGRMTYAKKKIKPFAEHDLRVTLECAGKKIKPFAEHDLRVTLQCAGKKQIKKKKAVPAEVRTRGKWYRRQSLYTMSHAHRLFRRSNLQYIKCYHNSKYEPSVFSAIFRHKQRQNVDPKQLALLK